MLVMKDVALTILTVFLIAAGGLALGRIKICGISFGTAGIFMVGLVFGHFGASLPVILQTVGVALFITTAGFSAGPSFIQRLKKRGFSYIILCLTTTVCGAAICLLMIRLLHIEAPLAVGVMTGAFTTSPGFAAAQEAVSTIPSAVSMVAAGYGLIYPIGVICKVLFIQLVPKLLHVDMERERALIAMPEERATKKENEVLFRVDPFGLFPLSIAVVLGVLMGAITVPLPGGRTFSIGTAGGSLLMGLFFGHVGRIGNLDMRVDQSIMAPAKEIASILFFSTAGVAGGKGVAEILQMHGVNLLIVGFFMVAIPLAMGFVMFRYVLKMPLLDGLGAMTASMTCTPSLFMLIKVAETDDVTAAYATTYPIALIMLVILVQYLIIL